MQKLTTIVLYFTLSIIITYWFIAANPVYDSIRFQMVAMIIAALVWGIQVLGALLILKEKKHAFLERAALVCLWGSIALLPSVVINYLLDPNMQQQVIVSAINVLLSVLLMTILFAKYLKQLNMNYTWVIVWLLCLAIAVPVQAKLVGLW